MVKEEGQGTYMFPDLLTHHAVKKTLRLWALRSSPSSSAYLQT